MMTAVLQPRYAAKVHEHARAPRRRFFFEREAETLSRDALAQFLVHQVAVMSARNDLNDCVTFQFFQRLLKQARRAVEIECVLGPGPDVQLAAQLRAEHLPVAFEDQADVVGLPGASDVGVDEVGLCFAARFVGVVSGRPRAARATVGRDRRRAVDAAGVREHVRLPGSVTEVAPLFRAAAHAYETGTRRILVMHDRKLVGILTGLDFARLLAAGG